MDQLQTRHREVEVQGQRLLLSALSAKCTLRQEGKRRPQGAGPMGVHWVRGLVDFTRALFLIQRPHLYVLVHSLELFYCVLCDQPRYHQSH